MMPSAFNFKAFILNVVSTGSENLDVVGPVKYLLYGQDLEILIDASGQSTSISVSRGLARVQQRQQAPTGVRLAVRHFLALFDRHD